MGLFSAALSFLLSSPAALQLSSKLLGSMLSGDKKKSFVAHQIRTYQGIARELGRAVAIFNQVQGKLSEGQQIALGIMYDSVLEKIDEGLEACKQFEQIEGVDPDLIAEAVADAKARMETFAAAQDRALDVTAARPEPRPVSTTTISSDSPAAGLEGLVTPALR